MSQPTDKYTPKTQKKPPLSLWKSIVLIIILMFVLVGLFGAMIYLFISGAQQWGFSTYAYIAIFVVMSGLFAWLVKRISDTASNMSHYWFSEDSDRQD